MNTNCSLCHGSGFDPGKSTCKTRYVADIPCPKCSKPVLQGCPECFIVSGAHLSGCSNAIVTITALHAYSLSALVEHWKGLLDCVGSDNCELSKEYCDEMLEDLKG
ncbi:hypothetical protein LCGC14_2504140 [marine sediment metagenome]|uniref:Uncharacterized protein n=1 Tax=marine sediment metagenome TaxID=412755 RepID=A0A0F9DCR7_9ZZZZ